MIANRLRARLLSAFCAAACLCVAGCSVDTSKLRDRDGAPSGGADVVAGGAGSNAHEGGASPVAGSAGKQGVAGSVAGGGALNGGAPAGGGAENAAGAVAAGGTVAGGNGGTGGVVAAGGTLASAGSGGSVDACTPTSKNTSDACDNCVSAACGAQSYECTLEQACYDAAALLDQCLCASPGNTQCLTTFDAVDSKTNALGTCVVSHCTNDCI